jgi:hypothetical protein
MPAGEKRDQHFADYVVLTHDDLGDLGFQGAVGCVQFVQTFDIVAQGGASRLVRAGS